MMIKCDGNHAETTPCQSPECWIDENRPFNIWWWNEGSVGNMDCECEDYEEHTHHISKIAWSNGADTAREDNEALANSIGAVVAYLLTQEQSFKDDLRDGKVTTETLLSWGIRAEVKGDHIQLTPP